MAIRIMLVIEYTIISIAILLYITAYISKHGLSHKRQLFLYGIGLGTDMLPGKLHFSCAFSRAEITS